jgi:hypothetical protein
MRIPLMVQAVLAVMILGLGETASRLTAAELTPPLTADEVKKLVNAGQYKDALQALIRILDLKGPAAGAYDRHEMLMLRVECQLQIKQNLAALDTLEVARKEAVAAFNDEHAMDASALTMLIKQSPGGIYMPQTGAVRRPLAINDRIQRKAAFEAMLADQMAQITLKIRQAKTANKLPPIAEAAKLAVAVRPVEHAAAGDNKQTDQLLADLSQIAVKLLTAASDDLASQTQRISDSANRVVTENVFVTDPYGRQMQTTQTHRVGITREETTTLKNVMSEAGKIAAASTQFAQFFANDPAPFKTAATKAATIKDKANTALTDNYSANVH